MARTLSATESSTGVTVSSGLLAEYPKDIILVTYGIKGKDDDNFVKTTGEASANLLKTKQAIGVSTGKEVIEAMEKAGRIAVYVNWGHSWNSGFYLNNNAGFYIDWYEQGGEIGDRRLKDLKKSNLKTRKHTLFIFASCGTARPLLTNKNGKVVEDTTYTFAYDFGKYINKEKEVGEGSYLYKITTIGATDLSNLFWDNEYYKGKIQCKDGTFKKIEKQYRITKKAIYKTETSGYLFWKEEKKVFSHYETKTEEVKTTISDLGKKIDVTQIVKAHDPENTSL